MIQKEGMLLDELPLSCPSFSQKWNMIFCTICSTILKLSLQIAIEARFDFGYELNGTTQKKRPEGSLANPLQSALSIANRKDLSVCYGI